MFRLLLNILPYLPLVLAAGFVVVSPIISGALFILWIVITITSNTTITNKDTGEKEEFTDVRGSLTRTVLQAKEVAAISVHYGKEAKEYIVFNEAIADVKYQAAGTSREAEIRKIKEEHSNNATRRKEELAAKKAEYHRLIEDAKRKYL